MGAQISPARLDFGQGLSMAALGFEGSRSAGCAFRRARLHASANHLVRALAATKRRFWDASACNSMIL
jgi:hypothetical protein